MAGKHIAFLNYRLDRGGIDRVVCLLAAGFAKAGYRVDLLLFCDQGAGESMLLPLLGPDVRVHYLGRSRGSRTSDLIRLTPAAIRWLRRHGPDCLISSSNNMNWPAAILATLARAKARVVLKTTNPVVREQDHGLFAALRKWGYTRAIARADRTLTLSAAETRLLQRQFPTLRDRFRTVVNPYVTPAMLDSLPEPGPVSPRKTILGIGRFEPQKRFDLLIRAFAALARPDADLVLLGDGRDKAECEALVRQLGVADRVRMPGFVDNIPDWLHRADLMVMTSRYEGLPAVVLEALATNCPVLATDCFLAAREILEPLDSCGIIDAEQPEAIARQIAALIDRPRPADLPSVARRYSIQNGIDDHIRQVESLF